jgi:hypothetical protein
VVDVAIEGLAQSVDKFCHASISSRVLQNSLSRRPAEVLTLDGYTVDAVW